MVLIRHWSHIQYPKLVITVLADALTPDCANALATDGGKPSLGTSLMTELDIIFANFPWILIILNIFLPMR